MNTGTSLIHSQNGLITTIGYQLKDQPPIYSLEGSVSIVGSGLNWLVQNLKIVNSNKELDEFASKVEDNGGVYCVPSFSGLFAPYWNSKSKGVLVGLTLHSNNSHIARAMIEGICFQIDEVINAMEKDSNINIHKIKVDGGVTNLHLLLQTQSDLLNLKIEKSDYSELTAFGAAICAGIGVGKFKSLKDIPQTQKKSLFFEPQISKEKREKMIQNWKIAIKIAQLTSSFQQ